MLIHAAEIEAALMTAPRVFHLLEWRNQQAYQAASLIIFRHGSLSGLK